MQYLYNQKQFLAVVFIVKYYLYCWNKGKNLFNEKIKNIENNELRDYQSQKELSWEGILKDVSFYMQYYIYNVILYVE